LSGREKIRATRCRRQLLIAFCRNSVRRLSFTSGASAKARALKNSRIASACKRRFTVTTVASIPVAANKASGKSTINLGRIGGPVCEHVPLVYHRPIPGTAKIKQVAITLRGERVFVVLMIEAPASELTRTFPPAGGRVAGIDQGRKIALSLSTPDGAIRNQFQPPLSRDSGFLRRSSRLERKADRQLRAGNPDLFR